MPLLRGQCLCGAVAFEFEVSKLRLYRCHCSLCRKHSGTASNCAGVVPADRFRWLSGTSSVHSWQKDTGYRSDFCSICGSPVPNPLRSRPAVWIPAGLLDEPSNAEVVADFHMASRAPWDATQPSGDAFAGLPMLDEFFARVQSD